MLVRSSWELGQEENSWFLMKEQWMEVSSWVQEQEGNN